MSRTCENCKYYTLEPETRMSFVAGKVSLIQVFKQNCMNDKSLYPGGMSSGVCSEYKAKTKD
jgi:hypothetical protein